MGQGSALKERNRYDYKEVAGSNCGDHSAAFGFACSQKPPKQSNCSEACQHAFVSTCVCAQMMPE